MSLELELEDLEEDDLFGVIGVDAAKGRWQMRVLWVVDAHRLVHFGGNWLTSGSLELHSLLHALAQLHSLDVALAPARLGAQRFIAPKIIQRSDHLKLDELLKFPFTLLQVASVRGHCRDVL